jgi:hypothetical protein
VTIDYELLESWPRDHILQEIRDAFLALQTNTSTGVQDEREGYVTSLQDGLFENDLDAEVRDLEAGRLFPGRFFPTSTARTRNLLLPY